MAYGKMADDPPTVAVIYAPDGAVYDVAWTWETAVNYVLHEGMTAIAVADDGFVSKAQAQAMYDQTRAEYVDCWGVTA